MESKARMERIDALDLMKWICAWLVVVIHTRPFLAFSQIADLYISQGLCRFVVPLFFAAAGFLLIRKMKTPWKSFEKDNQKILIHYIRRVSRLYLTWSCVYYVYSLQGWAINGMLTKQFIFEQARLFFLEASYYHLWYLLATIYAVPLVYGLYKMGRKWQYLYIALMWPFRCLQYAYSWTGLLSEQYMWIQNNCDAVFNVILCAVPLMTLGVLAVEDYKKHSNRHWLRRTIIWLIIYVMELSIDFYLSPGSEHFEFLFSCPCLIYNLFCWILTLDFHIKNTAISGYLRISSEWIYCVHPLTILIFRIFSGDTGILRLVVVCAVLLLTGIGYSYFEAKMRT